MKTWGWLCAQYTVYSVCYELILFCIVCVFIWSCLYFSFAGRTSSRFICGSIQERSLTCVHNVAPPLLTTTIWRTTCAYTPACGPISAQAALKLLCAQITCTATSRRTAATASLLVEAESLGCESRGSSMPPWACWARAPTQALGLVPSGDGGALKPPRQQRWMEPLEPMHIVLRCRSWQWRQGPEAAVATVSLLDTIVNSAPPVRQASELRGEKH